MLRMPQIKKAVTKCSKEYGVASVRLFGSYAKGEATEKSDIDFYVDSDLKGLRFVGFVEALKKALGEKEIDAINASHVEENSALLNEINKTGILLYER